ncbi:MULTISPECIES: hypothetical protein [unclassified Paludibacterium]|uniref:hypothetical protein n=1 Tax=unclassified Paludibacterium TaxID=2618429 RepID=UPI001C04635E|nr:hypothetical protein [Paludibacterium sp. B53371]BEV70520.1 hypothetical protein THUN1379_00020 [Paludibacterium sp. THUN1379]
MTLLRSTSLAALLLLAGCAWNSTRAQQARMPELFCHDADWALSGLREPRVAFNSTKAVCAADRLKLAAQIITQSDSKTDLARARSLVDSVLNGTEVQRDTALAGLAALLDRQLSERRRADERADKLSSQIRDQQQRIDDLNAKITALTALEKSMARKSTRKPGAGS